MIGARREENSTSSEKARDIWNNLGTSASEIALPSRNQSKEVFFSRFPNTQSTEIDGIYKDQFSHLGTVPIEIPTSGKLEDTVLLKKLKGVISTVTPDTVIISCEMPNETVKLSFPKASVPEYLCSYATTVYVALDSSSGFKKPVVLPREIAVNPHFKAEIDDMTAWIDGL